MGVPRCRFLQTAVRNAVVVPALVLAWAVLGFLAG
jgi:hypothetical protein